MEVELSYIYLELLMNFQSVVVQNSLLRIHRCMQ